MTCPNCKAELQTQKLTDNVGQQYQIHPCSKCGGFWFDAYTLYRVTPKEAEELDKDGTGPLQPGPHLCPNDNVVLAPLIDPNVPKDIQLFTCHSCHGVWVPKGQLKVYKSYQTRRERVYRRQVSPLVRTRAVPKMQPQEERKEKVSAGSVRHRSMGIIVLATLVLAGAALLFGQETGQFTASADDLVVPVAFSKSSLLLIFAVAFLGGSSFVLFSEKAVTRSLGWIAIFIGYGSLALWVLQAIDLTKF